MYLSHWLTPTHCYHPPTHTHTHSTLECTQECEGNDNPPNPKTRAAWLALCSTADLMNGHSDTQTKLRLDFYYTVGSRVIQSTDRSRNQSWMPVSLVQTLNHSDTPKHTVGFKKKKEKTCLQETLLILIYLHYMEAPLVQVCTLWATREH